VSEIFDYVVPAIFVVVAGSFAWRYFRHGSLTGALMGGRIEQSIGEIVIPKRMSVSQTVRVDVLRKDPAHSSSIVVSLTSKAVLGASLVPFELTSDQARTLADLLLRAANHGR
jgi:hypothetical protein